MRDHPEFWPLYNRGMNDAEIARRTYVSPPTVCVWRKRHGLPHQYRKSKPEHKRKHSEEIRKLYKRGYTDPQIADAIGICDSQVRDWRKRNGGLPYNKSPRQKKLDQIPELYERGLFDVDIALTLHLPLHCVVGWRRRNGKESNRRRSQNVYKSGETLP